MLEGGISVECVQAPALIRHPSDKHYLRPDQWSQVGTGGQQATRSADFYTSSFLIKIILLRTSNASKAYFLLSDIVPCVRWVGAGAVDTS